MPLSGGVYGLKWPWLAETTHDTTQTTGESSRWGTGNLRVVREVCPITVRMRVIEQTEVHDTSTRDCVIQTPLNMHDR